MLDGEQGAGGTDKPWYDGADPEVVGVLERRGIHTVTPVEAVTNLVKAHAEAERLIGVPASDVVRWPKDANDTANWQAVRTRLGVPTDPKEYDFSTIKKADGTDVDPAFAERMRATAAALQLPKDQAVALAKNTFDFETKTASDGAAERMAKAAAEGEALKTAWGANYEANRVAAVNIANAMLQKSGMKPEDAAAAINALENQVGGAKALEMFRAFSRMAAEDSYVDTGNKANPNVMSHAEAMATKAALMRDTGFVERWNKGDMEAMKQLSALDTIIVESQPEGEEAAFRRQVAAQYRS